MFGKHRVDFPFQGTCGLGVQLGGGVCHWLGPRLGWAQKPAAWFQHVSSPLCLSLLARGLQVLCPQ